jgi:hypothetical protein
MDPEAKRIGKQSLCATQEQFEGILEDLEE